MRKILLLFSIALFFSACYSNKDELLNPQDYNVVDTNILYSRDIQPLISLNCAVSGCHVYGGQVPNLSTHTGLYDNRVRVKERATVLDNMPAAGPLPQNLQNKLATWIDRGALNN